jgi:uncharacterized protein YbaP (TraB family)
VSRVSFLRALPALVLLLLSPLALGQQGSTPLLFEVRSATNTVYLFGTIHVGARKLYPLGMQTDEAFARAAVLALEADPTDPGALADALTSGMYQPPETLRTHIPPELYARLEAALPAIGLPIEYARGMKPFLLSMAILMLEVQRLGYDPGLGLDMHFARLAKAQGKPIVELESMREQIDMFAGLPSGVQEGMLHLALEGAADGTLAADLEALVAAWRAGDAQAIHESTRRELEDLPEELADLLYARIYDERNRRMAQRIEAFLAGSQVHFVAIGAGHLTGEASVPALLGAKGFAVRRL